MLMLDGPVLRPQSGVSVLQQLSGTAADDMLDSDLDHDTLNQSSNEFTPQQRICTTNAELFETRAYQRNIDQGLRNFKMVKTKLRFCF